MSKFKWSNQDVPRFSRQWWIDTGRSMAWVAVVTLLIWIYADMEFTDTGAIQVRVRLVTENPDELVMVEDVDGQWVEKPSRIVQLSARVRGSRSNVDKLKRRFAGPAPQVTHSVSMDRGPGQYEVAGLEILRDIPHAQKLGVSVLSTAPPTVPVRLERVVRVTVPVRLQYAGASLAAEPAEKEAAVSVAESVWDRIVSEVPIAKRVLRTETVDLRGARPGDKLDRQVEIIPRIGEYPVRLRQGQEGQVGYRLTIASREATDVEETIILPVGLQFSHDWVRPENDIWRRYQFVHNPLYKFWYQASVVVRGSRKEIEKLKANLDEYQRANKVNAYIILEPGDTKPTGGWYDKPVHVRLPHELDLEVVKTPVVQCKLVERQKE